MLFYKGSSPFQGKDPAFIKIFSLLKDLAYLICGLQIFLT